MCQVSSLENHKNHHVYGKINIYARPKITNCYTLRGGLFKWELKFLGLFLALISFCNFIFTRNTSALFVPTLSASVDQANLQVNGNQVINSTDKTTEIPFNFTVNTNNRTGYTATLSAETENTALTNSSSTTGAKIDSISSAELLGGFSNNTWGYKFGSSMNYAPIPALSTPSQILQTTGKTNGNESNQLSIGMKLADNLESGNYTNKLILSFVSNPYQMRAMMTNGPDFNTRVGNLDPNPAYYSGPDSMLTKPSIKGFKRSTVAPANSVSTINIEDPDLSDYEIKAWYNAADQSVYYYAPVAVTYLNPNSRGMFQWFTKIESLDFSNIDTSEVNKMHAMFYWMQNLKTINFGNFNTSNVTDMTAMFGCTFSLTELDLSSFDTSNVTQMSYMFHGTYVQKLDLSNFNTSNVVNMYSMFEATSRLKEIKFGSNFNTEKVINMGRMFTNTPVLVGLNLSKFNTKNVTNMAHMFASAKSIQSLDLSSFDTSNVTDMSAMFSSMYSIESLDISNFNTQKVTDMNNMFSMMIELTTLDISNFDTRNVTNFQSMFAIDESYGSIGGKLERIYVKNDFDLSSATETSGLFKFQTRLRGGLGSFESDPRNANYAWLRIDRPGAKGYFTRKP